MKKMISLALVLALATVFAAGCKKKEEAPKVEAPKVEAPKPVQAPMTGKSAAPADAAKPADAPAAAPAAPEKKH